MKSIAVVGFLAAVRPAGESGLVRNPLVGAVHEAAPVQAEVVERLTENLFSRMTANKKYEFVSPGQAQGAMAGLLSSNPAMEERELFVRLGKGMEVDGVLAGYLYRWVEREGAEYGVNRPASVAFDLYLIRSSDGAILWKGGFDKTQQSLTENLLDINTFLKAKGKWMSVEELAEMGLSELLERFPAGTLEGESRTQE
ncbi:lipoprotein [sediment metagenome]|uniref:Lipoprotein n=1 Tax=sediment metagenome TaxID=749907 RepID=D9PI08_9ZZZZ